MTVQIYNTPRDAAIKTAANLAPIIRANPGKLICFAAGDTPLNMLGELIALQGAGEVDLNTMYYAGLDEWAGLGRADKGSCAQVMYDAFYSPAGILPERMRVFDGTAADLVAEARGMDAWIRPRGGVFLTVLGVGMNGHVGFNEPGTPETDGCLVVELDEITRQVGQKYFDRRREVKEGVTIGWAALVKAEALFVMATGEKKADIVRRAFFEEMDPLIPASLMRKNAGMTLILDKDAAQACPSGAQRALE